MISISLCKTVSCKFENTKYSEYKIFKFSISVVDLIYENTISHVLKSP